VAALGELHLEQCLKELVQRHSPGLGIRVSPPIHSFREGLLSEEREEYSQPWDITTTSNLFPDKPSSASASASVAASHEQNLGAQLRTPPWVNEVSVSQSVMMMMMIVSSSIAIYLYMK
jgi:hypothetical protein